jgi:hypothetical protein
MDPYEVKEYAFKNNNLTLYMHCSMYESGQITWVQAMQSAAIHLANEANSKTKELIDVHNRAITPRFIMVDGEHLPFK